MPAFTDLLGASLMTKEGVKPTEEALNGKEVVGLYFSAHWCPPCRGFTPKLANEVYTVLKGEGKSFEIVFVSSDKTEAEFTEYYGEQPWLALPFAEREKKAALSKLYKVRGIPSLVLLDGKTGEVITTKGREAVADPSAFPWVPPTLDSMLAGPLKAGDGSETTVAALREKGVTHLFIYASAHWCPPCRAFTPKLCKLYTALKAKGVPMEGIFLSSDRDDGQFKAYFAEMPWLSFPFEDRALKEQLSSYFEIQGIPTLITLELKPDGSVAVVNADARGVANGDPQGERWPWAPPLVSEFDEDPSALNEAPCFVVLEEKAEDEWQAVGEALEACAKARAEGDEMRFGVCQEEGGIGGQIRKLCKLGAPKAKTPEAVLLDLSDDGAFYAGPESLTSDAIAAFVAKFKAGGLEKLSVKG